MTLYNLVKCNTSTVGTGTITVGTAVSPYKDFTGIANGTVTYVLTDTANTEIGHGTWGTAASTLSRDTVLASTNSNNLISLSGNATVALTVAAEDISYPTQATLWHDEATILNGNALSITLDAGNYWYGYIIYQNTPANGDSFSYNLMLAAGTYTLSILGHPNTSRGVVTWYIDDSVIVSNQSWYNASSIPNTVKTASVTISTSGNHVLKGVVSVGAGDGYLLPITKLWLKPAA